MLVSRRKAYDFRSTDHEGYEQVGRSQGNNNYIRSILPNYGYIIIPNPIKQRMTIRKRNHEIRDPRFPIFKEKRRLDIRQSSNAIAQFGNWNATSLPAFVINAINKLIKIYLFQTWCPNNRKLRLPIIKLKRTIPTLAIFLAIFYTQFAPFFY